MVVDPFSMIGGMFSTLIGSPIILGAFFLLMIVVIAVKMRIGFDGIVVAFSFGLLIVVTSLAALEVIWYIVLVIFVFIIMMALAKVLKR